MARPTIPARISLLPLHTHERRSTTIPPLSLLLLNRKAKTKRGGSLFGFVWFLRSSVPPFLQTEKCKNPLFLIFFFSPLIQIEKGSEKNAHLKKLEKASENLQLFKANILDYDSLLTTIQGCEGVFHVACPVPASKVLDPETEVIAPGLTGTLNVLKTCTEAGIRRVVVVSSTAAVAKNPNWPKDKLMDESSWSDKNLCRETEFWYGLSKTLAESAALEHADKTGLNVITVCPSLIFGPMLQTTVNTSSSFLLSIVKGIPQPIDNKLWHYVDVRDVAEALLLVYEKPEAEGRYICLSHASNLRDLVNKLKRIYPNYSYHQNFTEVQPETLMSSDKLKKLGWKSRTLEETLIDCVEFYQQAGFLEKH